MIDSFYIGIIILCGLMLSLRILYLHLIPYPWKNGSPLRAEQSLTRAVAMVAMRYWEASLRFPFPSLQTRALTELLSHRRFSGKHTKK